MNRTLTTIHKGAATVVALLGLISTLSLGLYLALITFAYVVNRDAYYDMPMNARLTLLVMVMLIWVTVGSWNKSQKLERALDNGSNTFS